MSSPTNFDEANQMEDLKMLSIVDPGTSRYL